MLTVRCIKLGLALTAAHSHLVLLLTGHFSDRRCADSSSSRVGAPSVRIQEPPKNGVNAAEVAEALTSGGKGKKNKAYRR